MRVCVFEDRGVDLLEPLTLTRPAFDLWCGAATLLEHQCRHFGATEAGALVRQALAPLCRLDHPVLAVNDPAWLGGGATVLVNARWLPPAEPAGDLSAPRVALAGAQVAYAVLPPDRLPDCPPEDVEGWVAGCRDALPCGPAGGRLLEYPWDLVEQNGPTLCRAALPGRGRTPSPAPPGVALVGPGDALFIDPSAEVEPLVLLDTRKGPVLVEREARVQAFSRLEGPCYIGAGTWVLGAHVAGSTVGPVCRVGGEVEGSILQGYSNKAHEGFLGHSYIGEWVNLGAGTQVSDLRVDYRPVTMTVAGKRVATGLTKVGAFLGDHTKTGINTLVNTGTVAGAFCQLFPSNLLPPRVVPSFCAFARGQLQEAEDPGPLLETAALAMRRRGRELTDAHANFFRRLHGQTALGRAQALRGGRGEVGA
jgi:UDP-N-acetylglucosamine diphosphorylase/glucosamine-1-phosphate N-acetyltransferase